MTMQRDRDERPRSGPLKTVDRALQVLLSFDEDRQDWGVADLSLEFGLDRSTAQRILASLAARGFLVSDPASRRYSLGPAMWRGALVWEHGGGMARLARPTLTRLARKTEQTVILAVPDGFHVRCVAAVEGKAGPLRSTSLVGEIYPGHAGATSRAYFAFLTPSERRTLIAGRRLARFGAMTITDEDALEREFHRTAKLGYALTEGEFDPATWALAVPLMMGRRPLGTLSLGGLKANEFGGDVRDHLPLLRESAGELVRKLTPS